MTQYAVKSVITAAACMIVAGLAFSSSAQAGTERDAFNACRKWTGEEGGEQIKCFDCLKLVGTAARQHWENVCPEYNYAPNWE